MEYPEKISQVEVGSQQVIVLSFFSLTIRRSHLILITVTIFNI